MMTDVTDKLWPNDGRRLNMGTQPTYGSNKEHYTIPDEECTMGSGARRGMRRVYSAPADDTHVCDLLKIGAVGCIRETHEPSGSRVSDRIGIFTDQASITSNIPKGSRVG